MIPLRGVTASQRDALALSAAALLLGLVLAGLAFALAAMPEPIGSAAPLFAEGARVSVALTMVAGALGLLLGLLLGVAKQSTLALLRYPAALYVWLFRGTPLLLQILFFYFALPVLLPQWRLSEFATAALALALNVAAYNAEVFRAAIAALPAGQVAAAQALGLRRLALMRFVVLPQALRIALPPLVSNWVALLKDSSLAYAIGVVELSMVGARVQAESFRPVPVFLTVAAVYLVLTSCFTQFAAVIERRFARASRA